MKILSALFSKPLLFSLALAILFATAVYTIGLSALEPARRAADEEISLWAHQAAIGFLIARQANDGGAASPDLPAVLRDILLHPVIASAKIIGAAGQTVAVAARSNQPSIISSRFSLPILDGKNRPLGEVAFDLTDDANGLTRPLRRRVIRFALLDFFLVFGISYFILSRRDPFLPQLASAIQQVNGGQFDIVVSAPENNQEYAGIARAFNRLVDGLKERERMRHSLGRIMDPKIAEILIKEDPKVGGLRRQATIFFCDIRNYTTICEQLTADELQVFLNEYWKETVEIIMEQEGTIDKFHGDGVCVIFGAPSLHPDDPLRAVRTAWRLVQNVEAMNHRREAQRKLPIQIGIGIHSGEVIAGHIGSERRMDYTVIGDVVNVAARIEELNKKFGTTILISDNVYEEVEAYVRVKTLTLAYLRGHKRPILVHALREFFEVSQQSHERRVA